MTARIFYITHPEVVIDPEVPVPNWPLSSVGRSRMEAISALAMLKNLRSVWASDEQKARDGAKILGQHLGLPVDTHAGLGENDRSATGFIAEPEFWEVVDAFFGKPSESIRGWETAEDAQARVVNAVAAVTAQAPEGDLAIVAHGGVGALLNAHAKGAPISKRYSQPGPGAWFVLDRASGALCEDWVAAPEPILATEGTPS